MGKNVKSEQEIQAMIAVDQAQGKLHAAEQALGSAAESLSLLEGDPRHRTGQPSPSAVADYQAVAAEKRAAVTAAVAAVKSAKAEHARLLAELAAIREGSHE